MTQPDETTRWRILRLQREMRLQKERETKAQDEIRARQNNTMLAYLAALAAFLLAQPLFVMTADKLPPVVVLCAFFSLFIIAILND